MIGLYEKMSRIYIAGAHSRGTTLGYYLTYLDSSVEIVAYLFDNDEENPENIEGVPVIRIDENSILERDCTVYIATRGVNFAHIEYTLIKCKMTHIIPVDVNFDLEIRNRFLEKYYASKGRKYLKLENLNIPKGHSVEDTGNARIYVAGSAFDKPLQTQYELKEYEKFIQVGTALTDKRLNTDCLDNFGDNISDKNAQFCELTGLYWIWKHATEDIVGLCHYRRHFTIPDDWEKRMNYHNIDVILPLPLYVSPSIEGNYRSRHVESNWDYMLDYVKENYSAEYNSLSDFFKNTALYSPCNMFIMKREILDELCRWMFPILLDVAAHGGILEDRYQNRYPGFISERLISYFFEKNRDKYKVVFVDKNFLP